MNLIVHTEDEKLGLLSKPVVETVALFDLGPPDWLIVCAGFEERALGILESAVKARSSFSVLLIIYKPYYQENKAEAIRQLCRRYGIRWTETVYNRQEPSGFGQECLERLSKCNGRIFIDVSAMSRILIVQLIVALGSRQCGLSGCYVAYAEAIEYPPNRSDAEAEIAKCKSDPTFAIYFLSSGIYDVTIIPELSSFAPVGSQTRLIVFPSLDAHHLTALRAEIQPSRISLIEGLPPDPRNRWRQHIVSEVNNLDSIQNAERFVTSTLDYAETLECLLKIYAKHSGLDRLIIAPTGSKMQTVAVAILRSFIRDVQIVYPTPGLFIRPNNYTLGVGALHMLSLERFARKDE